MKYIVILCLKSGADPPLRSPRIAWLEGIVTSDRQQRNGPRTVNISNVDLTWKLSMAYNVEVILISISNIRPGHLLSFPCWYPLNDIPCNFFSLARVMGEMNDKFCSYISQIIQTGYKFIVRRAGLIWSHQDFEWWWSVPLSSASLY